MINSRLIQAKSQSPQRPTLPVTTCTVLGLKQTTVRDLTAVPSLHAGGGVSEGDGIRLGKPHPESQEEKTAFTSRERTGPRWVCGFALFMKTTPEWVHEPDAAYLLHIKTSTLRNMRRERRLNAGTHWVYATGSIGGPVVYNIPEIRKMQRQRTIEAVQ